MHKTPKITKSGLKYFLKTVLSGLHSRSQNVSLASLRSTVCVCQCKWWKYTAESEQQKDYACPWKRNKKRAKTDRTVQKIGAFLPIIWPTCAHMCLTQPGSGSHGQGQPAPATWSWFDVRRHDADMQKLAWKGVRVYDHECKLWADRTFRKERKEQKLYFL